MTGSSLYWIYVRWVFEQPYIYPYLFKTAWMNKYLFLHICIYLLHVGNHNAWLRFAAPHHSTPISPKLQPKSSIYLYQPTLNSYTRTKSTTIPWQTASAPMLLYPNPPLHIPHNIRSQCSDCSLMWYLHISHLSTMWTPHPIRFRTLPWWNI